MKLNKNIKLNEIYGTKPIAILSVALLVTGCGTFQLSSGAIPSTYKTQEQMQLDNLSCKDQAKLEANTAERQAGAFALGFTIIGAPIAFELEKSKQREVYKSCMEKRGYRVLPPKDGEENSQASKSGQVTVQTPVPQAAPLSLPAIRPSEIAKQQPVQIQSNQTARDEAAQLQKIKELRDRGLITQEEYDQKRKEILDKL